MRRATPFLLALFLFGNAAISALAGVPVSGHLLGRDTDFSLANLVFLGRASAHDAVTGLQGSAICRD